MIKLRLLLEGADPEYDLTEAYLDEIDNTLREFKSGKYKKQPWEVARYSKIKPLWTQFMKYGFVRDERSIEDIASIFTRAIIKLSVNTMLLGHESQDPDEYFAEYKITTEKQKRKFYDWIEDNGQWRISDSALGPLYKLALELKDAKTAEEKLLICDKILNVVHPRSNLSEMFVEGGRKSLDDLAGKQEIKEFRQRMKTLQ